MLSDLDLPEIATRCAEETARFRRQQRYDSRYCYELFRCAILLEKQAAWDFLLSQFGPLVRHWIGNQVQQEELYQEVWFRFSQAVTPARWHKGDFPTLKRLLSFLRTIAIRQAIDAERERELERRAVSQLENELSHQSLSFPWQQATRQELAELIRARLKDDQEHWLVRLMFEYDMKPREIALEYPQYFEDVQTVYRVRDRLLERLKRDPTLRSWLEE